MRRALLGSLLFHLALTVAVFQWIAFNQVKYVPRDVYSIKLVAAGAAQAARPAATASVEAPPKPEPEPVEEKEDQMPPPPDTPKKKPEKKPENRPEKKGDAKTVPSTDVRRTTGSPDSALAGTGTGPGGAGGTDDVSVDGGDFPFASYISRMRQKIATAWVPAGSGMEERRATVYFRVHRDGSVSHVSVEQSSGVTIFDRSCQRAVLEAAPLPPLPREHIGEYIGVHFRFFNEPKQ